MHVYGAWLLLYKIYQGSFVCRVWPFNDILICANHDPAIQNKLMVSRTGALVSIAWAAVNRLTNVLEHIMLSSHLILDLLLSPPLLPGAVCNWLTMFSCMRGTPKHKLHHQIHPGRPGHFDAVIVWKGKGDIHVFHACPLISVLCKSVSLLSGTF